MTYNLTFLNTSNNIYDAVVGVNNNFGGGFAIAFLSMLFIVTFVAYHKRDIEIPQNLLATSFMISVVSFGFWGAGLIQAGIMFVPMVLAFGSLLIILFK